MPPNSPLLSIILPAYNAEKYIIKAIESILNQTFTDFELIIADDGSTDSTATLIHQVKDSRISISNNVENKGKIATVNRLLQFSNGMYITVHDADDISDPMRFQQQIEFLNHHPNYVMCGTSFKYVDVHLNEIEKVRMISDYNVINSELKYGGLFHGPTMLFRRSAINKVDSIYRSFFQNYNEDYDLSYRLVQTGKCTNLEEYLYFYRVVPGSLSKELTPRKKAMKKVVNFLADQRKIKGTDDLREGIIINVEKIVNDEMVGYSNDLGKIHRENADLMFYFKNPKKSMIYGFKAFKAAPFHMLNIKCLIFTIFKYLRLLR